VSLYEGLMAAATSGGPELQGQLLEWLLRPVHAKWGQPAWQATVESPAAFAREYMSFQVAPGVGVVIESRWVRWRRGGVGGCLGLVWGAFVDAGGGGVVALCGEGGLNGASAPGSDPPVHPFVRQQAPALVSSL